jgi:hypothetical protein
MRNLVTVLAAALALAAPAAASAQMSLGARLGFALPMGDAFEEPLTGEGQALSDGISSAIPLQLEASWRVTPDLAVGGYFAYGFGRIPDDAIGGLCDFPGVDCSARTIRLGVQAIYSFNRPGTTFVPWLGAGFGYEWASLEAEAPTAKATFDFSGFELLNLQAGGDYRVSPQFSIGPFLQLGIGRYSNAESEQTGEPTADIPMDETFHQWLSFGVRGRFDL